MNKPIAIAICLYLTLVLGVGLLWPKYQDWKDFQKKIEEKRIELQYKEEYFSELNKASDTLKEYSQALLKIDSSLPADPDLPSLFDFLQKASSQNGLILKGISPISTTFFEDYYPPPTLPTFGGALSSKIQETHLSLSLVGSYFAFKNFLLTLEKSARLIEVESIDFSSPKKGEIFTFNLKIKVYSY